MNAERSNKADGSVTLVDIAKRCGISRSAASYALRGDNGKVGEDTRKRVLEAAKELGYDPSRNQAARKMALRKSGTQPRNHAVCLTLPDAFGTPIYYSRILRGIMDVMMEQGYGLHLVLLGDDFEGPLPSVITKGDADGLLAIHDSSWFPWWMKRLRAEPNFGDRPVVTLVDPAAGCSCVRADDLGAGYTAATHLLDLGHRFVFHDFQPDLYHDAGAVPKDDSVQNRRLQGMQQAYRDRGLDPNEYMVPVLMPHMDNEVEERGPIVVQAVRNNPKCSAICAQNDFSAVRVWQVLLEAGIRIPDDLSLISFDDTDPVFSGTAGNILTTVRMPLREFGQEGASLILRAIDGQVKNVQNVVLPTELIVRQSTAPPRRTS